MNNKQNKQTAATKQQTANQTAGTITREYKPLNLEFPFPTLDGFLTPNENFYVRNHFEMPELEEKEWRLKIEGAIENSFEIDYEELLKMPAETVAVTLECAGNSRDLSRPESERRAVGTRRGRNRRMDGRAA